MLKELHQFYAVKHFHLRTWCWFHCMYWIFNFTVAETFQLQQQLVEISLSGWWSKASTLKTFSTSVFFFPESQWRFFIMLTTFSVMLSYSKNLLCQPCWVKLNMLNISNCFQSVYSKKAFMWKKQCPLIPKSFPCAIIGLFRQRLARNTKMGQFITILNNVDLWWGD